MNANKELFVSTNAPSFVVTRKALCITSLSLVTDPKIDYITLIRTIPRGLIVEKVRATGIDYAQEPPQIVMLELTEEETKLFNDLLTDIAERYREDEAIKEAMNELPHTEHYR